MEDLLAHLFRFDLQLEFQCWFDWKFQREWHGAIGVQFVLHVRYMIFDGRSFRLTVYRINLYFIRANLVDNLVTTKGDRVKWVASQQIEAPSLDTYGALGFT